MWVLTSCRGAPINIGTRAFITQLVKPLQEEISHKIRGSKFLHIIIKLSECGEVCSDFLTGNGLLLVWQTSTQKVANRGIGLEVTFGIYFQCFFFADIEPFLPLSHLKHTRKAFSFFRYWAFSSFKETQSTGLNHFLINTVYHIRVSPAPVDWKSWKEKENQERKEGLFSPVSTLPNCTATTTHCYTDTTTPVLARTYILSPPLSVPPIHYTLSAQKHLGTCLHPYRLHKPCALTNTSFFTPTLPTNIIKHKTSQITFVPHINPRHPTPLAQVPPWLLSDSFPYLWIPLSDSKNAS